MKVINIYMVKPGDAYWEYLFECENGIWILQGKIITIDEAKRLIDKSKLK